MKILHKIGLVGLVPIVALLLFSYSVIAPRIALRQDSNEWGKGVALMGNCAGLVHHYQIERGASAVFLKGGMDKSQLNGVRKDTDAQAKVYLDGVEEHAGNAEQLAKLQSYSAGIDGLRTQVDGHQPANVVIGGFTSLIGKIIDVEHSVTEQKTGKGLGKLMVGLMIFEESKEAAGRLRANLAATVAADVDLTPEKVAVLASFKNGVDLGLSSPGLVLDPENQRNLDNAMSGADWTKIEKAYFSILENSSQGGYGYDAKDIFATMTRYIDQLGLVLTDQQADVQARAYAISTDARNGLILWSLLLVAALSIATALLVYYTRGIINPLKEGVALAQAVALGDLSLRLEKHSNDEVGDLVDALNSMSDELQDKVKIAEVIAEKDLTVEIKLASDKDTLGLALVKMVNALRDLIGQANNSSTQVSQGAREIASASQSLSQGATEQAATLEEISSSMTEISDHTRENAENADQAKQLTDTVKDKSAAGIQHMELLVKSMEEINESSQQIGRIIKTVDDIAFQTNLLALNAAVEAARAGKHGKGFAVVAEEVRSLAGRSAKAARETSDLIEASNERVEQGSELAEQTASAFQEIAEGVTKATDLVGEIAVAAKDQSQGIGEITEGLRQVDNVVQQSTAASEELASSSDELAAQSDNLTRELSSFKTAAGGRMNIPSVDAPGSMDEVYDDAWSSMGV
jgi:methyl-accepting chemotaxis protein